MRARASTMSHPKDCPRNACSRQPACSPSTRTRPSANLAHRGPGQHAAGPAPQEAQRLLGAHMQRGQTVHLPGARVTNGQTDLATRRIVAIALTLCGQGLYNARVDVFYPSVPATETGPKRGRKKREDPKALPECISIRSYAGAAWLRSCTRRPLWPGTCPASGRSWGSEPSSRCCCPCS